MTDRARSRRKLLKAVAAAGGGVVAARSLPTRWTRPLVDAVIIPVHAQASGSCATVFSSDFNGALPAQIAPGTALLEGVQGYAGLGPTGNRFGGNFLRSETGNTITLTLTGLPGG